MQSTFDFANWTDIYVWLYFDDTYANLVYLQCKDLLPTFNITYNNFINGFTGQ